MEGSWEVYPDRRALEASGVAGAGDSRRARTARGRLPAGRTGCRSSRARERSRRIPRTGPPRTRLGCRGSRAQPRGGPRPADRPRPSRPASHGGTRQRLPQRTVLPSRRTPDAAGRQAFPTCRGSSSWRTVSSAPTATASSAPRRATFAAAGAPGSTAASTRPACAAARPSAAGCSAKAPTPSGRPTTVATARL